jgi:hypothetical protein
MGIFHPQTVMQHNFINAIGLYPVKLQQQRAVFRRQRFVGKKQHNKNRNSQAVFLHIILIIGMIRFDVKRALRKTPVYRRRQSRLNTKLDWFYCTEQGFSVPRLIVILKKYIFILCNSGKPCGLAFSFSLLTLFSARQKALFLMRKRTAAFPGKRLWRHGRMKACPHHFP